MSVSSCGPSPQVPLPDFLSPLGAPASLGSTAWFNRLLAQCEPVPVGAPTTARQRPPAAPATTASQPGPRPDLAPYPPARAAAAESDPYVAPDLDGPQPYLSVFAGTAPVSETVPASSHAAALPTVDRLHELPELPSSLFQLSGTLQPLVSAFAAAAEGEAFEAQGWPTTAETSVSAPAALTADNLEQSLPAIPLQHTCACSTVVSLNPVIWRHFEPPHQVMVHAGLRTAVEEAEVSFPLSIYSSLNPRVITTGVPARRYSPYQKRAASVGIMTRGAAAAAQDGGLKLRKSGSYPLVSGAGVAVVPARKDKDSFRIMEAVLIKRVPKSCKVAAVWHSPEGSLTEGNTLRDTPAWPGEWQIDVVCRLSDGSDHAIWLKSATRQLAASPEACLLSASGRSRSLI